MQVNLVYHLHVVGLVMVRSAFITETIRDR